VVGVSLLRGSAPEPPRVFALVFQRDEERTMRVHHPSAKPPTPLRLLLSIALSCVGVKA